MNIPGRVWRNPHASGVFLWTSGGEQLAVVALLGEAVAGDLELAAGVLPLPATIDGEAGVEDYLAGADLTQYFTDVVSAGTTYARKPDPAGNNYLIGTHGLDRDRTLAVGDRELDILAAKNAGIHACLFSPEFRETAADHRIRDFTELDALVGLDG